MVDGVSALLQPVLSWRSAGQWTDQRESNLLDGAAPFYHTYGCGDGRYVAVGAIENRFYAELVDGLDLDIEELPDRADRRNWPRLRELFAATFAQRTRDDWAATFSGTDACVTPVLAFDEADRRPAAGRPRHLQSRPRTPGGVPGAEVLPLGTCTRRYRRRRRHRRGAGELARPRVEQPALYSPGMRSLVLDYLDGVYRELSGMRSGSVADYIPELAIVDPDSFSICLATSDGYVYETGDSRKRFAIQSVSKPFTYALALADQGLAAVAAKVDVEPSGEPFNEISLDADHRAAAQPDDQRGRHHLRVAGRR